MATTQTPNYLLVKPTAGTSEPVSVQADLNDNWDKIDQDLNRFDRQVFSTAGAGQTWNKPARAKRVVVRLVGGGGSSGGTAATAAGQSAASGGGGGGGYSEKLFLASALASSETIDVGAGGAAPAAGVNNGNAGGITKFAAGKAYEVNANGGGGGQAGGASATCNTATGGLGGALGTGADLTCKGGMGGPGLVIVGPTGGAQGAYPNNHGGSSKFSGEADPAPGTGPGQAGTLSGWGGGGGGGFTGSAGAAQVGAAGHNGAVIVDTYY